MRRFLRETAFRLARADVLRFIEDHEEEIISLFREELDALDERLPEEELFIDIHMELLGEELLRSALSAVKRFLQES